METTNFYRIKTSWMSESEDGSLVKTKTEELAEAVNYTDAEALCVSLINGRNRDKFDTPSYEIVKTKIDRIIYSKILQKEDSLTKGLVESYFEESEDTGVGMYSVKVVFFEEDDKGREKKRVETYYTPAKSNVDASNIVESYVNWTSGASARFVIKDVKFDKAEAIYWTPASYESATRSSEEFGKC